MPLNVVNCQCRLKCSLKLARASDNKILSAALIFCFVQKIYRVQSTKSKSKTRLHF